MSDSSQSSPGITESIVAGVLGAIISLVCLAIPLVHFVSGPLGPAVGGFIGGSRIGAKGSSALIVGLVIGAGVATVLGGAAAVLLLLSSGGAPAPDADGIAGYASKLSGGIAAGIAGGAFVYAAGLGTLGAYFGGRIER